MKRKILYIVFVFVCHNLFATVRNVPMQYSTIQLALNSCSTGDTVLVQPGIYFENINWPSTANIKLLSVGDSSNTFIDGNNIGTVIAINQVVVDTNTVIKGFSFVHGFSAGTAAVAGGMSIHDCSPKFENVAIKYNSIHATSWGYGAGVRTANSNVIFVNSSISDNHTTSSTWGYGGGIFMNGGGYPLFRNVIIENNTVRSSSWNYGVGVYASDVNPVFENVIIRNNIANDSANYCHGTGMYFIDCDVAFINVAVIGNLSGKECIYHKGTGIYFEDCSANFTNVLVAGNIQGDGGNYYNGGGIYIDSSPVPYNFSFMNVTVSENYRDSNGALGGSGICAGTNAIINITNSVFWNPNPSLEIIANMATTTINYSNIRNGFAGIGNIDALPGFVSATDFHLIPSSPCLNVGTLTGAPIFDLDNMPRPAPIASNPDMGCYELNQSVSLNEIRENTILFEIFPNPATSDFHIILKNNISKCSITIFNILGENIFEENINDTKKEINLKNIASGVYYVSVNDGKKIYSKKLIVEHD